MNVVRKRKKETVEFNEMKQTKEEEDHRTRGEKAFGSLNVLRIETIKNGWKINALFREKKNK